MKHRPEELLKEIEKEKEGLPKDLHITRMCCALVAVSNEEIIKITEPLLKYCPLAGSLHNLKYFDLKEGITKAVKKKILEFGHFTRTRELYRESIAIPYGTSEMIMYALEKKGIDGAVTVCDGAGTVITQEPGLVQGIGARMNGLFYTSPIDETIRRIRERHGHVAFPETARIDQIAGLEKAIELGYKNIVVTINGFAGEDLSKVREIEKAAGVSVIILVVCTTGVEEERAIEIKRYSDLAWSCASFYVRDLVGKEAIMQIATKIPVFVLTQKGIDFVANYSSGEFRNYVEKGKKYIISGYRRNELCNYKKIKMGKFDTYLGEIDRLPLRVDSEPKPLI